MFVCSSVGFAQSQRSVHQTFSIDQVERVQFALTGNLEIVPWAGNSAMTELTVKLYDASPGVLRWFVGDGRYEILGELSEDETTLTLRGKEILQRPIRTRDGECYEEILVKIYLPESFEPMGEHTYQRTEAEAATGDDEANPSGSVNR